MEKTVIRWKLNEVMARKRIKSKDLAEGLGITEVSMYRLRKVDEMPRLTPERLNDICRFLDCQPGDLLVYEPDPVSPESRLYVEKQPNALRSRDRGGSYKKSEDKDTEDLSDKKSA